MQRDTKAVFKDAMKFGCAYAARRSAVVAVLASAIVATAADAQSGESVTVTGTLIEGGVPCRAMRGDDGALYTMRRTPTIRAFRPGERIRVEGKIAKVSICQQGITIEPSRAEKLP